MRPSFHNFHRMVDADLPRSHYHPHTEAHASQCHRTCTLEPADCEEP
ncbi:MAG TPA: hypothetical protein VMC02_09600 [Steroidobacteraceae bacterium]|nr:hypothetical protein [Steroidobacteraceae bacterium]